MVDVAVDAADSLGVEAGQADGVVPSCLADRKQPIRLPHHAEARQVVFAAFAPRKVAIGKEIGDQVVDDAEPMRLVGVEPPRVEVVLPLAAQRQEEARGEEHVDAAEVPPRQCRIGRPRSVLLELRGERGPREPIIPEKNVAVTGIVEADLPDNALRIGWDSPIPVVLGDAEIDEEGEAVAVHHGARHAESRLGAELPAGLSACRWSSMSRR